MRIVAVAGLLAGMFTASVVTAPQASASSVKVCATGCAFSSVQAAINAAATGDTIQIGAGKYYENVVVNKAVTLVGAGNSTIIYPGFSNPNCSNGGVGSLCGGAASNIVLVQSSNVTIKSVRLEGDNPKLTSGVVVGGADIDARNGIITDHSLGVPINNLVVSNVRVSDVFLRGIYASSGGTFNINHNSVSNVQADPASIAMFNFGGSGVFASNTVSHANDGISANWSKGTQFLGNTIEASSSGVHTDNNGGSGGVADLIRGNHVENCTTDGYGIFVFAPYVSATVDANVVEGCYVGLSAFGSQVSGQGPTFSKNNVDGSGAKTTDPAGTYGALLTTDLLGYGTADLTATLTANSLKHFGTGMYVTQAGGNAATVVAHGNSLTSDGVGASGLAGTSVNATSNWWGCSSGPNTAGCTTAVGTVLFAPWLTHKP